MIRKKIELLVRGMLKDKAIQNRLAGYELRYDPEDINSAIELTLLDINEKYVPSSSYTADDAPDRLLIIGIASKLMACDNVLKASNYIAIVDGGMQINRESNVGMLMNIAKEMADEFDRSLQAFKYKNNLDAGWGH